jgi:hypothetical protein
MPLGDKLERRAVEALAGRRAELERLEVFALGDEPLVMHVQGIPGIGKTHLLNTLAASLGAKGVPVVRIDAGWCEPSPAAVCLAVCMEIGASQSEDPAVVATSLSDKAKRTVLVLDSYESFRLLDSWLRQVFLPLLGDSVRTILSSREPPRPAWRIAPAWRGLFDSMLLEAFSPEVALEYLTSEGVPEGSARELNRVARGHPLALSLGLALYLAGGQVRGSATLHQVVEHMAELFLEDADSETIQVVQAACLVRTATAPLLAAMVPHIPAEKALGQLRALPFVSVGPHGLLVHEAVRGPVTAAFKSRDPARYQAFRRAASQVARDQYRQAPRSHHWRCTADVIYLLENENLREGFFPTTESPVSVEPARADDGQSISAMIEKFDGPQSRQALQQWWHYHPDSFFVVRNEHGEVQGFYQAIVASKVHKNVIARDPLAASWARDLPRSEDRAATLWLRRTLDRETGEGLSTGQAGCWLDIKRTYLELRPRLRWVYTCYCDAELYRRSFEQLGFRLADEGRPVLDRVTQHTFRLDMGVDSVDGWLGNLLAQETGTATSEAAGYWPLLDEQARELVTNGSRIGLTPLEFGLLAYLVARPNRAVARYELVEAVWGYGKEASTSNVVEAVVRSLRQKLGAHRNALETVRGVGYRYRPTT